MVSKNTYINEKTAEKQLFISWSGPLGKTVADLIYDWINRLYKNAATNVFVSTRIEPGRQGFNEIMNALDECEKGFFIITRERMNSPWLHFEAGAISKANATNWIIPIYVDINREALNNDPLTEFQSDYSFCYNDLDKLISYVGDTLGWKPHDPYSKNSIQKDIQEKINSLTEQILSDPVILKLHQKCHNHSNCYISENSGCLAHLDEDVFFSIRRTVVENAEGELIIAGPSLTEAIGRGSSNNRSLRGIIEKNIREKKITSIKLLLTDLAMIESYCTESNEAITRVMGSLSVLKNELFHICDKNMCNINVYFIPLHNIDHIVLTDKYMLYRSTKLWTSNGEYKGEFILYQNAGNQCEYAVQYAYLKKLMELCTKINFDIDSVKNNQDSYISREIKEWRRNIKQNGGHTFRNECPGELEYIHLYKLYYSQLTHYIACDWNGPNHSELQFKPSKQIKSIEALFDNNALLNDDTQRYLLEYIKETESLLRGVVNKYSTASVNGEALSDAHIFPSLDLGFPNNSVRLSGGFATGMLVTWKCGTPIVPVDATVNVCSSSVFELPDSYNMNQTSDEFRHNIEKMMKEATLAGYSFNFASGNHFIMVAEDEEGKKYLILHSSAKEFKESYIGLYPVEGNWYSEKIRIYPTPYVHGNRYIRYLKGEDATFFISLAKKLEEVNVQIHKYFSKMMSAEKCNLLDRSTYHHYYMPTDSSIALGTFVESPGTTVPIFSAPQKAICLYKTDSDQNWTIQLGGQPKCLIPHGWGQEISGRIGINVDYTEQKFTIDVNNIPYEHDLCKREAIKCPQKRIRQYDSCEEFLENQKVIKGKIIKTLIPKYLYCDTKKGRVEL